MNKKQLFCMWCGIAFFFVVGLITVLIEDGLRWEECAPLLIVFWPSIAIVTGGLIYTFRDKKKTEDMARKPINLKRGFLRLTIIVSFLLPFLLFLLFIVGTLVEIGRLPSSDELKDSPPFLGILFSLIWITYLVIRWLVVPFVQWVNKGFQNNAG